VIAIKISIGEMAKLHNVSIHTLRYYDKIELLIPSEVDTSSNYRYYDEYDCHILSKIKALKTIGLPINKIRVLLDSSIEKSENSLHTIQEELLEKISTLNEVVSYLDEQLKQIEEFKKGECYIEPKIIKFSKREGYLIGVTEGSTLTERIEALENFNKRNKTNCDVLFKPSRLMLINSKGERHLQDYLALKRGMAPNYLNHLYVLEEGSYGVIDHIGHSKDIDKSYNKLLKHINDIGMSINNEAIEILVINSSLTINSNEWRTQIQIPIK
jgi:MerR family transcriptional activator of bmr gene